MQTILLLIFFSIFTHLPVNEDDLVLGFSMWVSRLYKEVILGKYLLRLIDMEPQRALSASRLLHLPSMVLNLEAESHTGAVLSHKSSAKVTGSVCPL